MRRQGRSSRLGRSNPSQFSSSFPVPVVQGLGTSEYSVVVVEISVAVG